MFEIGDLAFQFEVIVEVAIAMLLGGMIGFERELAGKSAGLRTHMMMAGSAALLVALGDVLVQRFEVPGGSVQPDPIRIVEAVVTGVSFLGAGMIFRRQGENEVDGLTTASGVLLTAAIGICVALRQLVLALGVTVLTMVILRGLLQLDRLWAARRARERSSQQIQLASAKEPGV